MTALVVLAAGKGTRFGGPKQLVPVGPNGEAILDLLVQRAAASGFERAVVVTSSALERDMQSHLHDQEPELPIELVLQPDVPGRDTPLGTAHAVAVCAPVITGRFAVVNADDLYPGSAFAALAGHLAVDADPAVVAFRVGRTVLADRPVKRALLDTDDAGRLRAIRESSVTVGIDGVDGDEWVSMNMWGFDRSIFDVLERAVHDFLAADEEGEVLLPDIVNSLVQHGATVRVLECDEACIGITHAEDLEVVRAALA